jgi:hypothetical protein
MASEEPALAFNVVFETRKDSNEPRFLKIARAPAVKPRSLFSAAIRERASTSAYADPRSRYRARTHVGGLRASRPGRSTYPDGNPRTAGDAYMRRGLLLVSR